MWTQISLSKLPVVVELGHMTELFFFLRNLLLISIVVEVVRI